MTLRKLTPKEEVVFDLFVKQRKQSHRDDDFFIYDVNLGQEILINDGAAEKYGIGLRQQHEIIDRLIKDGIVDAEPIIEQVSYDSRGVKLARRPTSLKWEKYDISRMLIDDGSHEDSYFAKVGFDWIRKINDDCKANYLCTLSYDDTKCCFIVRYGNDEKYVVKRLMDGRPFEVLKYALEKSPDPVTRKELNNKRNNDILHVSNKESIATTVFPPNNVVHHDLKPFIKELKSTVICVKTTAKLTRIELKNIKKG